MFRNPLVIAVALVVAGCSKHEDADHPKEAVASQPASTAQTSSNPVLDPPRPQPATVLTLTGTGVVGALVGTAWRDVSASFEPTGAYGDEGVEGCDIYSHRGGAFAAMVIDGKIARIEVSTPGIRTTEGIGVGSSLKQLQKAYGKQLITEKNHYGGEDDHFVWQSEDRGLVFYMTDGKVRFMAGGGDAIRYIEGCL